MKIKITSEIALITYAILLLGAYVFSAFFPEAPFMAFATQFTIGLVAYITKRLVQKQGKYNGEK